MALAHLWDITREERFLRQLEEIVNFFISHDRARRAREGIPAMNAWCMIEGADLYQRLSGRADVDSWLVETCEDMRQEMEAQERAGRVATLGFVQYLVMSIGYERTGQERFLGTGLVCLCELMESPIWLSSPAETKSVAIAYRGLPRLLYHAHASGLLERLEYPGLSTPV